MIHLAIAPLRTRVGHRFTSFHCIVLQDSVQAYHGQQPNHFSNHLYSNLHLDEFGELIRSPFRKTNDLRLSIHLQRKERLFHGAIHTHSTLR